MSEGLAWLAIVGAAFAILRVRALRSRAAGVTLAIALGALLVAALVEPRGRAALVDPERSMPALLLVGAFAILREAAREDLADGGSRLRPEVFGPLAVALATALAVAGAADRPLAAPSPNVRPPWSLLPWQELTLLFPLPLAGLVVAAGLVLVLVLPWLALPDEETSLPALSPRRAEVFLVLLAAFALGLAPLAAACLGEPAVVTAPWAGGNAGLALLAGWAIGLPVWLARGPGRPAFVRRWRDELDRRRFAATAAFLVVLGAPVAAMAARSLVGLFAGRR